MNPSELITDKIIDYCKTLRIIMILGPTKSGKVSIARKLAMDTGFHLFIADEFIEKYGYEDALEQFRNELDNCYHSGVEAIFEGILCYRLLRKLVHDGYYVPDMIIKVDCDNSTITHFYSIEEPEKNINSVLGMNRGLQKIWIEILDFVHSQGKKLKVLTLNTSL